LFAAYKRGFLSGGFNGGPVGPTDARDFDQQLIRGFEGGVKARLLDGTLRTNLTAYNYKALGLQVTTTNTTPQGAVSQTTQNAGSALLRGIEFDANWDTPLSGLNLRGSIAYTHARYQKFIQNCYVGQGIAEGCSVNLNPLTGAFTGQDFRGRQIMRAPDWTATLGFNYEAPISSDLLIGLSGDSYYTSRYYTAAIASPGSFQDGYWQFDASVRLSPNSRNWEVALIGVNLSNRYYYSASYESLFGQGPTGFAVPGRRSDTISTVSRGRQVMLRLTTKF
jgi:iron complex outermembrane receptor protein